MAGNQKPYQLGTGFHFYQQYKSYKYHHGSHVYHFLSSFILLPSALILKLKAAYLPKNTQTQDTLRPSTRICCFTYQVKFRWRVSRGAKFVRNLTQPEWRTQMQVSISWFAKKANTQIGTNWRPAGVYKCWWMTFFNNQESVSSPIFHTPWFFEVAMTDSEEPSNRPLCDNFAHLRFEAARWCFGFLKLVSSKGNDNCTETLDASLALCTEWENLKMQVEHAGCQVTFEIC